MEFIIGIFIGIFLFILSMGIHILVGLILPGKKGYLKIVKEDIIQGGGEEKESKKLADRLQRLGFRITRSEKGRLSATRPRSPKITRFPNACPFSFLPINADIRFEDVRSDIYINFLLKVNTFVYHDTGESEYLNALSGYILSDDFDRLEPPQIQMVSSTYKIIVILGILSLGIALSFYYSLWPADQLLYSLILHGLGWAYILVSLFSFTCSYGAKLYPVELRKSVLGFLAPLLSLAALLFLGYVLYYNYEESRTWTLIGYILGGLIAGPFYKRCISFAETFRNMQTGKYKREIAESVPVTPVNAEYIDDQIMKIDLPLKKSKGTAIFMSVWLLGWVFVELMVGGILLGYLLKFIFHGTLPQNAGAVPFMLLWFSGWSVGGYFAIYTFLWNISAKEILYLTPNLLTIEKRLAWWKKIESYNTESILNFRKCSDPKGAHLQNIAPRSFAFEYGGKTIRFGRSVPDPEALQIERKALSFLPKLGNTQ